MGNSDHGTTYTYTATRFGFAYDFRKVEGSDPGTALRLREGFRV